MVLCQVCSWLPPDMIECVVKCIEYAIVYIKYRKNATKYIKYAVKYAWHD